MVAHSSLTDTAVLRLTAMPSTAPTILHQKAVVVLTGRSIELIANGTSSVNDWVVTAGTVWRAGGNPTSVAADYAGQQYQNTTDGSLWIANSTTAGDWQSTASGGGGGTTIKYANVVQITTTASDLIGGGFALGNFNVRALNYEYSNSFGTGILIPSGGDAGRILLPEAGTYRLHAGAVAYAPSSTSQQFFVLLQNITTGNVIEPGINPIVKIANDQQATAYCLAHLTIAGATVVELRQFCLNTTSSGDGAGLTPSGFQPIGAFIEVLKIG